MEFTNGFTVQAPLENVWAFMINAEEVAPCVPGAQITETMDSQHFKGMVKVKLGAVQMTYRGEMEMDPDESARRIVLKAKGSEIRGSGGASGTVTTFLVEAPGGGTEVSIHSQIDVTGRVAQFGRGIMQDVANRMIREFSQCLERKITAQAGEGGESAPETKPDTSAPTQEASADTAASKTATSGTVAPTSLPAAADNELKVASLVIVITRGRVASLLRGLANLIEPK